jgi:hypothetical protein
MVNQEQFKPFSALFTHISLSRFFMPIKNQKIKGESL